MHEKKTNPVFRMFYIVYCKPAPPPPYIIINQLLPFFNKAIAGFYLTSYPNGFHRSKTEHAAINHHKLLKSVVSWITGTLGVL